MTEYFDFMNRLPHELTPEFIQANYHHLDIDQNLWDVRRELKAWKKDEPIPDPEPPPDPPLTLF